MTSLMPSSMRPMSKGYTGYCTVLGGRQEKFVRRTPKESKPGLFAGTPELVGMGECEPANVNIWNL